MALLRLLSLVVLALVLAPAAHARPYDPLHPWYVEGLAGTLQPAPGGADFGGGQNYAGHIGYQLAPWADAGLSVGWANARSTSEAIETGITSAALRGRAWLGGGRWSPYAEASARYYRIHVEELDVVSPFEDVSTQFGGAIGGGVLYSRSTWWLGLGAELHRVLGETPLDEDLTFATYNLFIGAPLGN